MSRIETEYLESDQRRFYVPCPHCGHMDHLRWDRIVIEKNDAGRVLPEKTYLRCDDCGGVIYEHHKTDMLNGGEWRVTCPENATRKKRGYHINALYSPVGWFSWADAVKMFTEALGSPQKLKTFVNTVLGETWSEAGEGINDHELMERSEDYDLTQLPEGVLLLTAGVDVQPDRLEIELVGWGVGEESWSLDYKVIRGDPQGALVWQQLDVYLGTKYMHPVGVPLGPANTFIDSGGANTVAVYDYVRERSHLGIYAVKGIGGENKPAVGTPQKNNIGKIPLVPLGVNTIKDVIHGRLKIRKEGAGYCHFPKRYGKEYYEQLTAEEVRVRYHKGYPVREWYKKTEGSRNEAFDCRVYATAAMLQGGWNFDQLAEMFAGAKQQATGRKVRGSFETS